MNQSVTEQVDCSEKCPDCHPQSCSVFFECDSFFQPKPDQELMVEKWNAKHAPGTRVIVERPIAHSRTLTRAEVVEGQASIYVDGTIGPVPLSMVRLVARPCEHFGVEI